MASLSLLLTVAAGSAPVPAQDMQTPNLFEHKGLALGLPLEIRLEALDAADAQSKINQAIKTVQQLEIELDSNGFGTVGRLNAAAGLEPEAVEEPMLALLQKALGFCFWTEGAFGPLGGTLYRLWGLDNRGAAALPVPSDLAEAAASAACDRLAIDPATGTARVANGSLLDLRRFAAGTIIDQTTEHLQRLGVTNAWLTLAGIHRAIGSGPHGTGWPVVPPRALGQTEENDPIVLRDQAFISMSPANERLRVGGEERLAMIDQRSGQPTGQGIVALWVVTELAVDVQGLAHSMLILGNRQGQLRLGNLKPAPSLRWLLGSGASDPVVADYRWSNVARQ